MLQFTLLHPLSRPLNLTSQQVQALPAIPDTIEPSDLAQVIVRNLERKGLAVGLPSWLYIVGGLQVPSPASKIMTEAVDAFHQAVKMCRSAVPENRERLGNEVSKLRADLLAKIALLEKRVARAKDDFMTDDWNVEDGSLTPAKVPQEPEETWYQKLFRQSSFKIDFVPPYEGVGTLTIASSESESPEDDQFLYTVRKSTTGEETVEIRKYINSLAVVIDSDTEVDDMDDELEDLFEYDEPNKANTSWLVNSVKTSDASHPKAANFAPVKVAIQYTAAGSPSQIFLMRGIDQMELTVEFTEDCSEAHVKIKSLIGTSALPREYTKVVSSADSITNLKRKIGYLWSKVYAAKLPLLFVPDNS